MTYNHIDIDLALKQLGESDKLYKTLLNGFYNTYQNVDKDIRGLLEQGQTKDARRLAHSIKGLSGNLGASIFREKAMKLEFAIRDNSEEIESCLTEFSGEFVDVIYEVRDILNRRYKDIGDKETSVSYGKDEFLRRSKELISALETYKYGEVKQAAELFTSTKMPIRYRNNIAEILKNIDSYDYDLAIELLKEMVN